MEAASTLRGAREDDAAAQELTGREAVDAAGGKGAPAGTAAEAGERAVSRMDVETRDAALDYFMEDDFGSTEDAYVTKDIEVNVGTSKDERIIPWTIRSLDPDTIQAIRERARPRGNRASRRSQEQVEVDEMKAAVGMVAAATISPDLEAVRAAKGAPNKEAVVLHRFRHKPGLILQISGDIMELSGYDEDDVRDAIAAKNS